LPNLEEWVQDVTLLTVLEEVAVGNNFLSSIGEGEI
jgi:hypothetical protein